MLFKKLKTKLKKFMKREDLFVKAHQRAGLRIVGALIVLSLGYSMLDTHYLKPKQVKEFAVTSVKVVNMSETSGGSGVILSSSATESIVLTNKHVCKVIEEGGLVVKSTRSFLISAYKESFSHDLCEIKVNADLGVNTKVASEAPEEYSEAFISGHPNLLPHVLTKGNFSGRMTIRVNIGVKKCSKEDYEDPAKVFMCIFTGGIPVIETFDSQLVTGTIMPGSSGSAVFNENGEIAGLVFAGNSKELSYAFIVPQEYIYNFVNNEAPSMEWSQAKPSDKPKEVFMRKQERTEITFPIYQ